MEQKGLPRGLYLWADTSALENHTWVGMAAPMGASRMRAHPLRAPKGIKCSARAFTVSYLSIRVARAPSQTVYFVRMPQSKPVRRTRPHGHKHV